MEEDGKTTAESTINLAMICYIKEDIDIAIFSLWSYLERNSFQIWSLLLVLTKINYSCSQKWVIQRLLLEQIKIFKIPLERWQESPYPNSRLVIAIQHLGQLSDQSMWEQYLSHLILGFCDIDLLLFFCNFSHTKIQYQNVI